MTTILTTAERIPGLKEALSNADPAVRFNAALDLVKQGDGTGIPILIEAFTHESGAVRLFHASKALVQLGQPAVPALTAALQSNHPQVRIDAACTLYQIVPTHFSSLLPLLTEALQSADPKVMSDALHFLSVVDEQAHKATVPALLQALRSMTPAADPEGWVTNVSNRDGRVSIDFGNDGSHGFSAVITAEDRRAFRGYELDSLIARHVRIRGMVQNVRGRAEIALSNPAQIEILN